MIVGRRFVFVLVMFFLFCSAYALADLDAIISYRSNTGADGVNSPKIRFWNSTGDGNWGSEIELPSAGSPIRYTVAKWSPISNKIIIITQSDDGNLDAYVCMENCTSTSSWVVTNNIGNVWTTPPFVSSRRFDVEFETTTGDAILVYAVDNPNPSIDLSYKVLPAENLSFAGIPEQNIDDTGHGVYVQYTWVRMDRNPNASQELIAVGFDDTNADINAWVWNGSTWGNLVEISASATSTSGYEALAVRYASDGSKGMVVGANGTVGNVNTRYWNGSAWSGIITFDITPGSRDVRWANLKADPTSDDLQGVFIASLNSLGTAYWNGSTWTITPIDPGIDTSTQRCADFEWDYNGSQGYLIWDTDGNGNTLSYRLCAPQCTGTISTIPTYAGIGRWITLYRQPNTLKRVRDIGVRLNSNFDIGSFYINSSTPTIYNYGDAAITADTTVGNYEAYSVAFKSPPAANVSVIKVDQTAYQPSPGGTVEFNITVTNTGNVTLNPVLLVDTLPDALIYSSASITPDSVIGGAITWNNIGPITPSSSVVIYLNATVNGSYGCDYNVTNLINVSGVPPNGDNATGYDTADVYLACANVSVIKVDQTAYQPSPGGTVEFNITVTNTGNVTLNPVLLVDTLPDALIYSSASITPDSVIGGAITWNNIGPITPSSSVVIYLNATVNGSYGCDYNVTNLINVSGVPPNGDNATGYDTADVYLACANVSVIKVDITPVPVSPGGMVEWMIKISNPGQVPLDPVFVTDTLPVGFQYDSASPLPDEISSDNRTINWTNAGPLPVGGSTIILLNSSVGSVANGTYYNTVFVIGTPPNGDDVNASDTAQVGIFAPGIGVVKTAYPTNVQVGQDVTYTLNISNTGSVNITVTVVNVLPFNVSFKNASIPPTQIVGQVLIWGNLTNLSIDESILLIYNVSANASGAYANNATAIGAPPNGYNVSDSSYATFTVSPQKPPSHRGKKEHKLYIPPIPHQYAKVDETKTVLVTVENTGDYNEYDVVLSINCPFSFSCKNASLGTIQEDEKKNGGIEIIGTIEGDYLFEVKARNDETYASREFLFTVLPQCTADSECKEDEKCEKSKCVKIECEHGYVQDHRCINYECYENSECNKTSKCVDHTCVQRQYNITIYDENVSVGENFTLYITEDGMPAPSMAITVSYPDGLMGIFVSDENGRVTFFAPAVGRYMVYLRDIPSVSSIAYSFLQSPAFTPKSKIPMPTPEGEEQPTCCLFGICYEFVWICWYWWALAIIIAGVAVVFRAMLTRSRPPGPPKWEGFNKQKWPQIFKGLKNI